MAPPRRLPSAIAALLLVSCAWAASRAVEESPAVAPPEAAAPAPAPPVARKTSAGTPFGFEGWPRDEPLSIQSGELEAVQRDGRRRLLFRQDVRVRQGDLQLHSARLEATYPENSGQPDRLVATGEVRLTQGERRARCDSLTYDRAGDMLVCRGHAEYEEGDNRLTGTEIRIDLASDTVNVTGGASVTIQPEKASSGAGEPSS